MGAGTEEQEFALLFVSGDFFLFMTLELIDPPIDLILDSIRD